jgi:ATP-dependent Clp protease ATP-binding subunit ClpB
MASLKLTDKSQEALVEAQRLAEDAYSPAVEGLHLLKALSQQAGGIVPLTLSSAGVEPRVLEGRLESELERLPKTDGATKLAMGDELRTALRKGEDEALQLKDEYVSTEHLLLALSGGRGSTAALLAALGLTHGAILAALIKIRGNQRVTDANPRAETIAIGRHRQLAKSLSGRQASSSGTY